MNRERIFLALIAALAALSFSLVIHDEGGKERVRIEIRNLPPAAPAGDLRPALAPDGAPETLRNERPAGVPAAELEQGDQAAEANEDKLRPEPLGGAQNYSCRQDFRGHVYSSRGGVRPSQFVLHYTVSPNRKGWGDVTGIRDYFARTRVASSTYIVDFEGHCLQMVPFSGKPWTQGHFNPSSVSVEIIATGRETRAQWSASPLIKRGILAAIVRDNLRRMGAPPAYRNPSGCRPIVGYTDHNSLECGNDHTDVAPAFPFALFAKQVRGVDAPKPVTRAQRVACRKLTWYRAKERRGRTTPAERSRARQRKAVLKKRGVTCDKKGARKR